MKRTIIEINEEKCDGCGLCVNACHEGAIQMIDGKARLVSDVYCDGLGDCIGECPQGAITTTEREAAEYDPVATVSHLKKLGRPTENVTPGNVAQSSGCPGCVVKTVEAPPEQAGAEGPDRPSELRQWPVQIPLVPPNAPYLRNADIALIADCVPFAYPEMHRDLMKDKVVLIACPKLDNAPQHTEKLAQIFAHNHPRSISVVRMEVPCCGGLRMMVEQALTQAGVKSPVEELVVTIKGEVLVKR